MQIAIYSGSFNPIHNGHTQLAAYIAQSPTIPADKVLLTVTPRNPLKSDAVTASDLHRLEMARIACRGLQGVEVSDFEMHLPQPWYTCRTLDTLARTYPHHRFRLVIGADNWHTFHLWRNPRHIISRFGLLIYPRPGFDIDPATLPPEAIYLPDAPQADISSTIIRQSISTATDSSRMLHPAVAHYITSHNLYGVNSHPQHNDNGQNN